MFDGERVLEGLQKLLFEISSSERMTIMYELKNRRQRLSHIAKKLDMHTPEALRHLQRLVEDKLVQKEGDGLYGLTQFGTLALSQLSGINFLSEHRKYFLDYDVSGLPHQFIDRIGNLEKSTYVAETLANLEEGENRIREAQQFVWILSDQVLSSSIPSLMEKVKQPFDLRIALPEGKFPPETKSRLPSTAPGIQKRVLPKVCAVVVMTEKYGVFCLPNTKGNIDYTGFTGTDPKFLEWCKDLFLYYWEKAKPFGAK